MKKTARPPARYMKQSKEEFVNIETGYIAWKKAWVWWCHHTSHTAIICRTCAYSNRIRREITLFCLATHLIMLTGTNLTTKFYKKPNMLNPQKRNFQKKTCHAVCCIPVSFCTHCPVQWYWHRTLVHQFVLASHSPIYYSTNLATWKETKKYMIQMFWHKS